jgi:hypothetical protein
MQVPFVSEPIPADDAIPPYREASHGVPDPAFPQPQPRHPPHPIIEQPGVQPPPQHQHPQQPPQHPQHVYEDMTSGFREFAVRTDRRLAQQQRDLDYLIESVAAIARSLAVDLTQRPVHPAVDDDVDDDDDDDDA